MMGQSGIINPTISLAKALKFYSKAKANIAKSITYLGDFLNIKRA